MDRIPKPQEGEYIPYTITYLNHVSDEGLLLSDLEGGLATIKKLVSGLSDDKLSYRYAEGKWTLKEVLVHIADTERIMSARCLRVARNDKTPLPGFEQDDYAPYSHANERGLDKILQEYESVRKSTISLLDSFSAVDLSRTGIVNGYPVSACALACVIAGHEQHHIQIIRENYLF